MKVSDFRSFKVHDSGFSTIEATCVPMTEMNPYGKITDGSLQVDARILPLTFTLDLSGDRPRSCRRLRVTSLKRTAIFVLDYDFSSAKVASETDSLHEVGIDLFCIGDFSVERTHASVTEPANGEDVAVSLVVQRIDEDRYKQSSSS
jgi:hypothetical protein